MYSILMLVLFFWYCIGNAEPVVLLAAGLFGVADAIIYTGRRIEKNKD